MAMRGLAIATVLLAACHARPPVRLTADHQPADLDELLASGDWVTGELSFPFGLVLDSTVEEPRTGIGRLRLDATAIDGDVTVRSFGNFSRLVCAFPKLVLKVGDAEPPPPYESVFLITHCNDASAAIGGLPTEEQVAIHEVAYELARVIGLASLRTRLARLRFVDTGTGAPAREHDAFFLEHARDLARRLTGDATAYLGPGDQGLESYRDLDPLAVAVFHLFQIMINNRDWELLGMVPMCRSVNRPHEVVVRLHNAFVLMPPREKPLPVPFDFEISSFVGVPEAVLALTDEDYHHTLDRVATHALLPDGVPLLRWMVLRLQHFRASHDSAIAAQAIAEMKRQQDRFEAVIRSAILSAEAEARAGEHLSTFFTALDPLVYELPRIVGDDVALFTDRGLQRVECARLPAGLPVEVVEETGEVVRVRPLQKLVVRERTVHPVCAEQETIHPGWVRADQVER